MTFADMLALQKTKDIPGQVQFDQEKSAFDQELETITQQKYLDKEYQALIQEQIKKARKGTPFLRGLKDLSKILAFVPGVGTGISAGIGALADTGLAARQEKDLKGIARDPRFDKYRKSFIEPEMTKDFSSIKDMAGEINPFLTGISSFATSSMTGDMAKNISQQIKTGGGIGKGGVKSLFQGNFLDTLMGAKEGKEDGSEMLTDKLGDLTALSTLYKLYNR